MYTSDSPLRPYLAQPIAGVTVFFVISGFLLYRPFVRRAARRGEPAPDTRAYAWRRFLRIVPAYWLALTVIAIWLSLDTVFDPAWHIPVFYGFAQIYVHPLELDGLGTGVDPVRGGHLLRVPAAVGARDATARARGRSSSRWPACGWSASAWKLCGHRGTSATPTARPSG